MANRAIKIGAITKRISKNLLGLRRDMVALGRAIQAVAMESGNAGMRRNGSYPSRSPLGFSGRRRRLTAADRARLRVQGEYLGLVRHLSSKNRVRIKDIRARRGYAPAIKEARRLVRGKS